MCNNNINKKNLQYDGSILKVDGTMSTLFLSAEEIDGFHSLRAISGKRKKQTKNIDNHKKVGTRPKK